MARHLTVASAIDKNKIASENVWLVLCTITVRDEWDNEIETLRIVKNNEDVTYQGQVFTAAEFDLDFSTAANEEPNMTFSAVDPTGAIRDRMEDYNGGVGFGVVLTIVNTGNMGAEPEIEEEFDVLAATAPGINVSWTLGAENPLKYQFPYRRQYRDRCPWVFKGKRCKYVGAATACDFTLNGPNGCRVKSNTKNFGGFPSLRSQQ
jgi:phage-related protein